MIDLTPEQACQLAQLVTNRPTGHWTGAISQLKYIGSTSQRIVYGDGRTWLDALRRVVHETVTAESRYHRERETARRVGRLLAYLGGGPPPTFEGAVPPIPEGFKGRRGRVVWEAREREAGHHWLRVVEYEFDQDGSTVEYVEAGESDAHSNTPAALHSFSAAVHLLQNVTDREVWEIGNRSNQPSNPPTLRRPTADEWGPIAIDCGLGGCVPEAVMVFVDRVLALVEGKP